MRNSSDKLGRQQAEALRNEDRIFLRYQAATKEYNDVLSDVAKQESQDAHKNDLKNLERYAMGAKDKKTGEIDPNKINKEYRAAYAETLKRVNERKEGWSTAIEDAKKEKNLAFSRIKNLSPEAVEARTGPKVNPADSGAGTTGNFPTPTAKHIQALKDNPGAKAEFDGKFGPGAADEYLGK
jgi:seryl-tRNA synthetase